MCVHIYIYIYIYIYICKLLSIEAMDIDGDLDDEEESLVDSSKDSVRDRGWLGPLGPLLLLGCCCWGIYVM